MWVSVLIACVVIATLAAAHPRADTRSRDPSTHQASQVSVAYLEAWLSVRPDSVLYLESLAMQYLELGRWQAALTVSRRLSALAQDDQDRQKAFFMQLVATEQMVYAESQGTPERAEKEQHLASILKQTTELSWTVSAMRALAEKARAAGVDDVMVSFYQRLATADVGNGARWQARLGEVALATQAYETAAFSYFLAYDLATIADEKRLYFIKALQVLESADRIPQACSEAEARLGTLATDRQTLRYLVTLARKANRGDLVTRYARALLESRGGSAVTRATEASPVMFVRAGTADARWDAGPDTATLEGEYQLIYQAFIESSALDDAEKVARMALERGLDATVWSSRLAQAAQWNNHPETALEYWLVHARAVDTEGAWRRVLEQAPGLDDDEAYLTAWQRLKALQTGASPDIADAMRALVADYMKAGHWAATLRVLDRLKALEGGLEQQNALLLEITALERHAYEFDSGTPQRIALLRRLHDVMERTLVEQWDMPIMKWIAQKAKDTGANTTAMHYYRRLVVQDAAHAAAWQEKLGDLALSQQAYEEAASAYFAAQAVADSRQEKIRLFQSGLGAYVAGGKVERACEEGERRAGDLLDDPATLRYLINLARQAHRTDLMTRYARELIKVTQHGRRSERYPEMARNDWRAGYGQVVSFDGYSAPRIHADYRVANPAVRYFISDASGVVPAVAADEQAADLEIAFRAFVESRQLDDAQSTARQALEQGLDPLVWQPRLAQVAEWRSQPQTALRNWLAYAQASDDAQAWVSVLRLSSQLNDAAARLAALRFMAARSPDDMDLLDQVVGAFELLGQPEAGLAYLKGRAHGHLRVPMMERYARLAARSGNDGAARAAYESLQEFGPHPHVYALGLASMAYAQGDLTGALSTLRAVRDNVGEGPETSAYWRLYRELAALQQSGEDADFASRRLLATEAASDSDLNALTYLYARYPIDGARIAETQFHRDGSPDALLAALRLYTMAHAWARIDVLMNGLTAGQRDYFGRSAHLLAARADYYARTQRWEAALADLRTAIQVGDATDDIRIAYLWMLVEFGTVDEIRMALHRWRQDAGVNSEYWGVLAALEMRLGNALTAAHYLRNQRLSHGDDPLWLIALANAEEASGYAERAWTLRRTAWKRLREKAQSQRVDTAENAQTYSASDLFRPPAPMRRSLEGAEVALSQGLANGDYSKALLIAYLEREGRTPESRELSRSILADTAGLPPLQEVMPEAAIGSADAEVPDGRARPALSIGDTAKEVVLAWALSAEQYDLARVWLARQYADHLLKPVNAEVTLALEARDKAALNSLLDDGRKNLSIENRIQALTMAGRQNEAQELAFSAMEGAPDNDERHQLMAETLMPDRPAVGFDVVYADSDPLKSVLTSIMGEMKLTNRWGIGFEMINRKQSTSDRDVLAWVPAHDRELAFKLQNITPDRKFTLIVGARDALDGFLTASLRADLNRQSEFKASVVLGLNQFTDLSQTLQVGGVKDLAEVSMQWDPDSRWFFWGSAQASRLLDQKRVQIGRGLEFTADIGYRLFASHPDWSIRLTAARGMYSASGNQIESLRRILPEEASVAATDIIPRNFTQYGVMVGFGVGDQNAYWRRWRMFMDAGYVRDSNEGWGPLVNVGVAGSVVGKDHLRLFYQYTAARQGDGRASTQIGLSYRLFF